MSEQAATAFAESQTPTDTPNEAPKEKPAAVGHEWLTEKYREDPRFNKFESVDDLAESYSNAEQMMHRSLRIPGEDASEDQRNKFYEKIEGVNGVVRIPDDPQDEENWNKLYNKMGRPEKPEDYSGGDEDTRNLHHKLGLSDSQSQALLREAQRTADADKDAKDQQTKEDAESLREAWGDGFDRNITNAKLAAKELGGDEFVKLLTEDANYGSNITVLNALAKAGELLVKNKVPLDIDPERFNLTRDQVDEQIAQLRSNEAYQKGEKWAADRMEMLYKKRHPGKQDIE